MKLKMYTLAAASLGLVPWLVLPRTARAEETTSAPKRPLIDLNFPGGTVADYADAVLKAGRGQVNIVVMPDAREFGVPPLQLTSVDVSTALGVLEGSMERHGRRVMAIEVREISPHEDSGREIFAIHAGGGTPDEEKPTEAGVWTISDLLGEQMKSQDVLTAIQTALEMGADQLGPVEIKFHEATGLVIAQGHYEQINRIAAVIMRLIDGQKRHAGRVRGGDPAAADRTGQSAAEGPESVDELKRQVQELSAKLAKTEAKLRKLQKSNEDNMKGTDKKDQEDRDSSAKPK